MPRSVERRRKCHSPRALTCCKRKSSVQVRRHKRNESRECKLRAESAGNLDSRRKSSRESAHSTFAEQHESKLNTQGTSSVLHSKGCKLLPLDVTDCLKNVNDWEAMEIRILDKDTCTVLRPGMPNSQRSDKVIVHPSLYHTDHTIKGSIRRNQKKPHETSVLKQTVCVEKVHVRNLLHTKREKCGNLGSSRSSEYMPCESTRPARTHASDMDNRNYCRLSGSNTGVRSFNQPSETSSCDSLDTTDLDIASAHTLHAPHENGSLDTMKASLQLASGHDGKQMEDDSSSHESEEYTNDNDEDSEDESSGSDEDESDDDDDENEMEEEEEQNSDHSGEESMESSVSDDSYYKKYYKERNNKQVKNTIKINADGKQIASHLENTALLSQCSPDRSTLEKQPAESNTQCKNKDLKSRWFNWQNAASDQTLATSQPLDSIDTIKHSKTHARDWSATPDETHNETIKHSKTHAKDWPTIPDETHNETIKHSKTHSRDWPTTPDETHRTLCHDPFYNENVNMLFSVHQGEPAMNLNEPSTSLSVSEGKKWDSLPHNRDYFSSTQSISTLSSTTVRKAPFIPMPEEEIACYKQIALQILTERKQRALEDNNHANVQPVAPHKEVEVQLRQVTKKKRSRPSRKYHKSTRLKSKDAKSSEVCQNSSCRSSQRAGFWASWRIKNQIEKHRKRFHSTDVNTSKVCRPRSTQACLTVRCPQKSPKQSAHKDRNSDIEHAAYFPSIMFTKLGSIKQKPQPLGRTQSKRLSCQLSETLKSKHESKATNKKISNASFKVQKPVTKTHSSLFCNNHVTFRKPSASIPFTMRSTQSQYYLKPSTNTPAGTKKASNMSGHPLKDGKPRAHYENGSKLCQMGGKACAKWANQHCNTEQANVCQTFAKEKQTDFNSEPTSTEGKKKVTTQASDTSATEVGFKSESFSKSMTNAVAPNKCRFNVDNTLNTNQNLPKKPSLPSLADWESESQKRAHQSTTAANEEEATSREGVKNSLKSRAYLDLLQNILKSPTAKAAQAVGTFLQKPEAQETADRASDVTVDQIISSYQKLFDQLHNLSSKNTANDKLRITENLPQMLGSSQQMTEMKTPTDTNLQNTTLTGFKKAPDASQTPFKHAITENNDQGYLASKDEQKSDANSCLKESNHRDMSPRVAAGVCGNKPSWKGKEITKSTLHAAEQEVSQMSKYNTAQAAIRGKTTSSARIFRSQVRPLGNHDSRPMWRFATPDKRTATEDRLTLKQNENRKSKSSHDSSETIKTTYKQSNHTQRKPAVEVRCSRTASAGILENKTNHEPRAGSNKSTTTVGPNKLTSASTARKISFSDSSCCGVKPKINTCLKTSLSCTRQPTVAAPSRTNVDVNPSYKCKHTAQVQDLPDKVPSDGKRKCMQQTVTKATHVGLINATDTSVQCMATIQSNPESNSRLTNKFLVHKQCTSSIKTHALVTSAGASARMMTTDRIKPAGKGQPLIKDVDIVRDAGTNSENRELSTQSLHIDGQYHQVQEHSNSNRTVECSTKSVGKVRTYPAITIIAPQACLNILAPKPSASSQASTAAANETAGELEVFGNDSSLKSQLCLPLTPHSEVPNDRSIEPLGANKENKHDDKSVTERKDSTALKPRNALTQRRPTRPALKSNSEQWTRRDEHCVRKLVRSSPNCMALEGQKQVHFKSRSAFKYGLSASSSILTHVPRQREQNTSALPRMWKKATCTTASGVTSDEHTNDIKKAVDDQASVTNSISPAKPCIIETTDISRMETNKCTSTDAEVTSMLPRESPTKPHSQSTNGNLHIPVKNISAKKIKPEEVCPPEDPGCAKNKGTRVDRKSSLSWSKQHLTKSQEVKDKHFVTSTALRAIFVTAFSPFRRVDDKHRSDTEAHRRPLAWQKRRCRSAEGFEVKNATSRLFTYGKKKVSPECFPSSAAGKSLKSDTMLRASASNCALTQDTTCSQVTHSGPEVVGFLESKSTMDSTKTQHCGDAIRHVHNPAHMAVKPQGSTKKERTAKKEPKTSEKWNTSPWKPTVSEDESELSDGSSLQAVRKQIVANTCRMIIRESRNLIVSNPQRHTREDSPQKATPADSGCDHEQTEVQNVNQIINDTKDSINLAAVLDSIKISSVAEGENKNQKTEVNLETRDRTHAISPTCDTEGPDYRLIVAKLRDSSAKIAEQPTNNEPSNVCSVPLESVSLSKLEISLPKIPESDIEYGEGLKCDGDIKDMSVSRKRGMQGNQYPPTHTQIIPLPAHTGVIAPVTVGLPNKDIFYEAVRHKQLLEDSMVAPDVDNRQEKKQMEFDKHEIRNVRPEIKVLISDSEPVAGGFQEGGHERIADTFLPEEQVIRDPKQNLKCEFQENTNIKKCQDEEQKENSDQKKVARGASNITEQGTRKFGERSRNTQNVNDTKEQQYEYAGEKVNTKEHESDDIWQNNHNVEKKGRDIEDNQKDAFQNQRYIKEATKDSEQQSKDTEYKVRQKNQGNYEIAQISRNGDKGSGDVKQRNRQAERKDSGDNQDFKVVDNKSRSAMHWTRERVKESVYVGQKNGDARQGSQNVDEESAYMLQRYKNTEQRVGNRQQDNVKEKEQKNRTTDEKSIGHCSREIIQKRKDKGPKARDEGDYNKSIDHEESKYSRTTENEDIDKWRRCRTTVRGKSGTMQKSRSVEQNKSADVSQTKSSERLSAERSQQRSNIDNRNTEIRLEDTKSRRVKLQSRSVDFKNCDTREGSRETMGKHTSAEHNRQVGQTSRNGELTHGERNTLGGKTRKLAEVNKETQHNKGENIRLEDKEDGHDVENEAQHVRDKRYEQRRMSQEKINKRHQQRDISPEKSYVTHELRNSDLGGHDKMHEEKDASLGESEKGHEKSGMLLEKRDKKHEQAHPHLEQRDQIHKQKYSKEEERDTRHVRRDITLQGKDESPGKTGIEKEEINKRHKEGNRNIQERYNRPRGRDTYLEGSNEMCKQRDPEHEERDKEYVNTEAQLQETDTDNEERDEEFEEKYNKREMKLNGSSEQEECRNIACTIVGQTDSQEHSAKEDQESIDNVQESRYTDKGKSVQHTRQHDGIALEKSPKTRCQNVRQSAYETQKIFGKYRRLNKESREFGKEIQGKAGEIEHNDQAKKDMRHGSSDRKLKTISTIRKSKSAVYESNDWDTECSRGMYQDKRGVIKNRMQRVRSKEPKTSSRKQEMVDSQKEKTDERSINRSIKQTSRNAAQRCEHTELSKFVLQASQQNRKSESEDEVYFPATREGHKELVETSGVCDRKPKKYVGLSEMPHDQLHKVACVANTTQTEETCLSTFSTARKGVQTRDQHTEIEEILLANKANEQDIGEMEDVLQDNKIHMIKEQPSFPETLICVINKHLSPEELRTLKVSPQCSQQSLIPQMYTSKPGEVQIDAPWEILRRVKPQQQALEHDKGLFDNPSEMHMTIPVLPVEESTRVLAKTVSSAETLATIRGIKRPSLKKTSKSCEAVAMISPHNLEKMRPYLYNGTHSVTRSTQERIWNVDRELLILIGNEVSSISNHLPAKKQKQLEDNCGINALQTPLLSATGHREPSMTADDSNSFIYTPVTETAHADTGEKSLLPMFKQSVDDCCRSVTDMSTRVAGILPSSVGGKEHPEFVFNVNTSDTTEAQSQYQPRNGTNDDITEAHTNYQQKNEPNDGTLEAHTQYQQRNRTNDDTMEALTQQRNGTNEDTTKTQKHHQHGKETNYDSTEADTFHQQMNASKEVEFHNIVAGELEKSVTSQQQQHIDITYSHGKQGLVVRCESSPHVNPVHLCVDTCSIVMNTASAHVNLDKQGIVFETTNTVPAVLQAEHTDTDTLHRDRFIPHSVSNQEKNCPNDGFKCTNSETPQDSPRCSTDEIVDEPAHITPHSTSSTRHSLTANSAQPWSLPDTQQTNLAVSPKNFVNCGFQNIQQDLHLEMPYTSVNSFSIGHVKENTSEDKGLQCYFLDETKPETENQSQTQHSAESITMTKAGLQEPCRCNAKLPEHFQRHGSSFRDLAKHAETAHTEHNDLLQRMHPDNISASKSQETIVPRDTVQSNQVCAQACQLAHMYTESSGCVHCSKQMPCSCCHSISKSHTMPGVCLHDPHHCCIVQGDRTRHTPAHVSFQDECPLSSRSDNNPAVTINSGSKSLNENKAQINAMEVKPHEDTPCLYCLCEAKEQSVFVAPSSDSYNDMDPENPNKVKRIKQEYAHVTRCHLHKDNAAMRTRERALNEQENAIQQSFDVTKLHQSDSFLICQLSGQKKGMSQSIHPNGKESSIDTAAVWKKDQHSSSKSVQTETSQERFAAGNNFIDSCTCLGHDQVRAKRSLKIKLSHETSTQTLLKQSDFDDSLESNQSISRDNKVRINLLRDSCIGTSDIEIEDDLHLVDAGTSKHETVRLDDSFSGVHQATSNIGCVKALCSPLSSLSSKTEGITRRVLTRSPDVKGNHIQHKAMENLELFVKSTRERHVSAGEPRTSPPYKPCSQSLGSGHQGMFLMDFVTQTTLPQHTSSCNLKPDFLVVDTSLRDKQMHSSECTVKYSKPTTDKVQLFHNTNRQTSPVTDTKALQKQMVGTPIWMNSAGSPASTPKSFLCANKLHVLGCWERSAVLPAISQKHADNVAYQEVTRNTLADDHSMLHIPYWPNKLCFISSPRNDDLRQKRMEPTRNPIVAVTNHEISKGTLAASPDETYYMRVKEGESRDGCSLVDQRRAVTNVACIHNSHSETTGPALFYKVSGMAVTASTNTETSQSASFTRSCTNPFLQSTTNPFIPSAPLLEVPRSQVEPTLLHKPGRPTSPLNIKSNPFLDGKTKQLTFDACKSVADGPRFRSRREDSPDFSTCFFKENTHNKLNLSAIDEFLPPLMAISENISESLHQDQGFESNTLGKYCSRYLKRDGDLMLFSDASRDTDETMQEDEAKGPTDKRTTSACPLAILPNQESSFSAMQDKHCVNMPMKVRDNAHQIVKKSNNKVHQVKVFNKQEVRKRRRTSLNSRINVELWKPTYSFHKKQVFLAGQSRQDAGSANSAELESGTNTSPESLNNSISDNLTSRCLLLKKGNGVQTSSDLYAVYNSSAETLDYAVMDVSSSYPSLRSCLSEDHSDTINLGRTPSPSPSPCQAQADDQTANLNILETVTTLTSKFMDIFNGLKKNIHKSTGRHIRKHKMPNLQRYRHYKYMPISKNAYPYRKVRNGTKKSNCSRQHKIGSCFQEKHCHLLAPKSHSQLHNQNGYKLHKYAGKQKATAMKKSFIVKSSNTVTSMHSDELASTSNTSEHRMLFHRRKKRRGKINEDFSISPHVHTEYMLLPVCSSNSESAKPRAASSHTNSSIINDIPSDVNQTTVSDKSVASLTGEQSVVQTESVQDHTQSLQGMLHAPNAECRDNHHSYPEYMPHVFLPQYSQLYVSVHNGSYYVMPTMPFLPTIFTIVGDGCEPYLPEQHNKEPKLVLVDDQVDGEGMKGGDVEADLSAAAKIQNSWKQTTPLLSSSDKNVRRFQQESDSRCRATSDNIKLHQRKPTHWTMSMSEISNDNLSDIVQLRHEDFAHYVDVVPLIPNADIHSKDGTKQDGSCEVIEQIMHAAEGFDNSWNEKRLYEPYYKYTTKPNTDHYDAAVSVKSTIHSEVSSSNLEHDLARFSASGLPSLHGQYYIKDDLSSPPKRRKCDHSSRTPCPVGASISKQTSREWGHQNRDCHHMGLGKGCNKKPCMPDLPIPSMTFETKLKAYSKETMPHFCHEHSLRTCKFINNMKDGGASNTYSYIGQKECFGHMLRSASPLSNSLTDCSEKRDCSIEMEVPAKAKDEKQYHYDDCEPDTYDELGSLCSEMQDTTSKLFQGDADLAMCKDPACSYESKSMALGPTLEVLLSQELAASPNSISNVATQTIHQAKRTSCSHYFGDTLECSKKDVAISTLVTENKICQLATKQAGQFPIEQRNLLSTGKNYQHPAGYLENSGYKKLTSPIWNIGLITLRSAPVTRSCFTQTEKGASGADGHRPSLVEIRELMTRCIKSRHFRYYVQHIVDERIRSTLPQKLFYNSDGNRTEKTRGMSSQKKNKKRRQPLNDTGANGKSSATQHVVQTSLPSFICQENITNQDERIIAAVKSLLARKSSSSGFNCVKQGLKDSQNEASSTRFQWPCRVEVCQTGRTTENSKSNDEYLTNSMKFESALPEEISDCLSNSKKPLRLYSRKASNDSAMNGIVSRSLPTTQTGDEEDKGKSIKLWSSATPSERVQKNNFCLSPLPRINSESIENHLAVNPLQEHGRVHISEKNMKSPEPLKFKDATDVSPYGKMATETAHIFENTNLHDVKATDLQPDAFVVDADFTNNTKLEMSVLTDNNTFHTVGLPNESAYRGCNTYETDESARIKLASVGCACAATHDVGAQEMSDLSSSSSAKIDYGRLKNIMSAETKLLWKNLTRLENSYDRCKRCRKQYESILGSNKISGECETRTEKLDTACELHSEDFNITRCSNQSTEMIDDCPKEKCASKNGDDIMTNTEHPIERSQENMATCDTDKYTHQVFNEVNTQTGPKANYTSRVEHTRALYLSSIRGSAPKCEDQFNVAKTVKNDGFKKPWHVKGKNTAKMIQIFERGNGFFQDSEQQENASNENLKKPECSRGKQEHENTSPGQQTNIALKNTVSKWAGCIFQMYNKKVNRSAACDDETKLNDLEGARKSSDCINRIDKEHGIPSNTKCLKLSPVRCDVANQQTSVSTANITDAQHILAMNAPNSETDEWIQKLVNILHEMQQTFPQITATSANSAFMQDQVDQTQEVIQMSDKNPQSLLHCVGGKVEELYEANIDVICNPNLKGQRKTPVNTPPMDHSTGILEQDHSRIASMPCFQFQSNSKDIQTRKSLDKRVFHSKNLEHYDQCKVTKPDDSVGTEEMSVVTQKMIQESLQADRIRKLDRSQQKHIALPWLLKSTDLLPCLMSNTDTCPELASPNKCMDENNQASGSLQPTEQFCCENVHIYDTVLAGSGRKRQFYWNIFDQPCYATKYNLDRQPRCSCIESCSHNSVLEKASTIYCGGKATSNITFSVITIGTVREVKSCITLTNSHSSAEWAKNKCSLHSSQLKASDRESQSQTLQHLCLEQDARCINGIQLGKSPSVTRIDQDVFVMSSGKTCRPLDDYAAKIPRETKKFDWSKSARREVHKYSRNLTLQETNRNNKCNVCFATRDITSKYGRRLLSESRRPDCNFYASSVDSCTNIVSKQLKTDNLCLYDEMVHDVTRQDSEKIATDFSQEPQWKREYTNGILDESDRYKQNTHSIKRNLSSQIQRSNVFQSVGVESKQSSEGAAWWHSCGTSSVLSEEDPGCGKSYELTMATMNDVKDTTLISNDEDFIDDIDTLVVTRSNTQADSTETYPEQNNTSHSGNANTLDMVPVFHRPELATKKAPQCSTPAICEGLAENETVSRSHFSWKHRGRKGYSFWRNDALDTATYSIAAKCPRRNSKRHKSLSPPSVSLKEYISSESQTVNKDISSCLRGSTSVQLESRNQQTVHLQSFDIPIDIYTVPVYRHTSPQKKRKKRSNIPTRTVVISGPVRNMSIAVQHHKRSLDQGAFTNRARSPHSSSLDMVEGSSPTDRSTTDQMVVSGYDRKSVPTWKHAMKRMLPFGKRTSHEKKIQTHLVT